MNFVDSRFGLCACSLLLAALNGCSVSADVNAAGGGSTAPTAGTLTILSSIEGSTSPSECDFVAATDLELAVYEGARLVTTVTSPCDFFEISVALSDGIYNADVTLLDNGQAASTTLTLDTLRVAAGTDLQVEVDFPANSILP
ncbi:MAG: hypothetical protein ABI193_27205 [Minicystis sp.]